jgi:membrane fusion protein, copper/silver efflux system
MNDEINNSNTSPDASARARSRPRRIVAIVAITAIAAAGLGLAYRGFWPKSGQGTQAGATAKEVYYCPMHPQQRSDKPGNCPICSMKLVKMEGAQNTGNETKEVYYCPMHPQQQSDKPGNCPICSMKLVKMEKPKSGSMAGMPMTDTTATAPAPSSAENTIFIAPERQQLIGVRTVPAQPQPLNKEIRTVGKIAFDETKIAHIHTKVSGFIEDVFVDYVGRTVRKGEPLFTIYSPDLVATQEEYLLALKSRKALKDSTFDWIANGSDNLLKATRRRLQLWDITSDEIDKLEQAGEVKRALTIYSPVNGIVTERAAYHHGRYVTPETDLYAIVDLSTVWILGEIYEYELPYVQLGQTAEVEFPYTAGADSGRRGKVVFISPTLNPKTRTVEIRLEFPNPNLVLRPDMFVNFRLNIPLGRRLVVPQDAVLRTGTEDYVFVDRGNGYFEPRLVTLGPQASEGFVIEKGLAPGDRVVTAANFILDSESRLKGAFANMGSPKPVPVAGAPAAATENLKVEILEPKTAKTGSNNIRLSVKDTAGKPIEGAEVQVTLFMPQMGNMAPMTSKAALEHTGGGVYAGKIDVPMAWTWETTVTVEKGGQALGSVKTTLTAR